MNGEHQDLAHWLGEFDYNRIFFAEAQPNRTSTLLTVLSGVRFGSKTDARDLLLAYREHAQELLAAIKSLEKIVG